MVYLAWSQVLSGNNDYDEAETSIDEMVWVAASAAEGSGKTSAARYPS